MSSDNLSYPRDSQNDVYTAASFLRRGAVVVPAAAGVFLGAKALLSNTPGILNRLPTNALGQTGVTVGNAVRNIQQTRAANSEAVSKKILDGLMQDLQSGGKVRETLQQNHQELNSKISALLEALDDPEIAGSGTEIIRQKKRELTELMVAEGEKINENASKIVSDTLTDLYNTATANGKRSFAGYLAKYDRQKRYLVPPSFTHQSGKAFNTVADVSALSGSIRQELEILNSTLNGAGYVSVLQHKSGAYYARITASEGSKRRILDYPLSHATVGNAPIIWTGEGLTTPNSALPYYGRASDMEEALGGRGPQSVVTRGFAEEHLLKTGRLHNYQTWLRREIGDRLRGARGNMHAVESMTSFAAEALENIPKIAFGSDFRFANTDYASHIGARISRTRSAAMIYDFQTVSATTKRTLRARMMAGTPEADLALEPSARPFFDPSTPHLFTRTSSGTYATVGIRSYGNGKAPIEMLRSPTNTRQMFPATLRIEQAAKREEFFIPREIITRPDVPARIYPTPAKMRDINFMEGEALLSELYPEFKMADEKYTAQIASGKVDQTRSSPEGAEWLNTKQETLKRYDADWKAGRFNQPINPVASTMGKSGTFRRIGQNIEWTEAMTGGMNKVAILAPSTAQLGLGEGEAYVGAAARIRMPVINTVFDPSAEGQFVPAVKALNEIFSSGQPLRLKNRKEIHQFFRTHGTLLGIGPEGPVHFKRLHGLTSLTLEGRFSEVGDKQLLNIVGYSDIVDPEYKAFSISIKGTSRHLKKASQFREVGRRADVDILGVMKELGLTRSDMVIGAGTAFKKGMGVLQTQIISAFGLFEGFQDPAALFGSFSHLKEFGTDSRTALLKTASAVAKRIGPNADKWSAASIGLIFGSLHSWAPGRKGWDITQTDVEDVLRPHFTPERWKEILPHIQKGYGIDPITLFAGPPTSGWGTTQASLEPRFIGMMHQTLTGLGFTKNEADKFLAGIVGRVEGKAQTLEAAKALTMFHNSINGRTSYVSERIAHTMKKVDIADFMMASSDNTGEGMRRFLAAQGGDFLLDFKGTALEGLAKEHFHGSDLMFIPAGSDALMNMRAAKIKTATGNKVIEPLFIRQMQDLGQMIQEMMSLGSSTQVHSHSKRVGGWLERMSELHGQVIRSIQSGKVKGSSYVKAQSLIFGEAGSANFDAQQLAKMQRQYFHSGGHAAFSNTQGFLTSMKDAVSAAEADLIAQGIEKPLARKQSQKLVSENFRNFFLSGEMGDRGAGIFGLVERHPNLSAAHIAPTRTFRVASETGRSDKMFRRFTRTFAGRQALNQVNKAAGTTVTSWQDLAKLSMEGKHSGEINQFFQTMASRLNSFMSGEGGGVMYLPQFNVDIAYEGGVLKNAKYSPWGGAGGDYDGDMAGYMSVFERNKKLTDVSRRELAARSVHQAAIESTVIRGQISQGIANYSVGGRKITAWEEAAEAVMKEETAKNVGELSTTLGSLRQGVFAVATPEEHVLARQANALMYAMEEVPGIASKHLTRELNLGQVLQGAVMHMMRYDDPKQFWSLLNDVFMRDTALPGGIRNISVGGAHIDPEIAEQLTGQFKDQEIKVGQEMLDLITRGARHAQAQGYPYTQTAAGVASVAGRSTPAHQIAHDAMRTEYPLMAAFGELSGVESAGEFMKSVGSRLSTIEKAFDRRMLGPAIIGIGAAIGLGLALHSPGYSPEPLMAPGEIVAPKVQASIAAGSLFDQGIKGPSGDEFMTSERMNTMDRPIAPGTAYFDRRNAYQIRGELRNPSATREVSDFMNGIGGSASIRINDTRRPLTPNYIDRLQGE